MRYYKLPMRMALIALLGLLGGGYGLTVFFGMLTICETVRRTKILWRRYQMETNQKRKERKTCYVSQNPGLTGWIVLFT